MSRNIVVIGVNYGADDMVERFVRSITNAQTPTSATIKPVLVDNTEGRGPAALFNAIKQINPNVLPLKAPKNLGYYNGAHYGYQQYLAAGEDFSWVLVSNVDLTFDKQFFTQLEQIDYRQQNIGAVGPSIWSSYVRHDLNPNFRQRPERAQMHRYKLIFRNRHVMNAYLLGSKVKHFINFLRRRRKSQPGNAGNVPGSERLQTIYAPHGSLVAFSKLYFEVGGTLAYPCFLFGEELYVAETARDKGIKVVYAPALKAYHDDHTSTGVFRSPKIARYVYESAVFIADTYFRQ